MTDVLVQDLLPWIKEVVAAHQAHFPRGMSDVRIMMDGATWHVRAVKHDRAMELMDKSMSAHNVVEHPSNSPDMQGPIEWTHHLLVERVQQLLVRYPTLSSPSELAHLFTMAWEGGQLKVSPGRTVTLKPLLTPRQVSIAFRKLEHVYKQVERANGDWSEKGC